MKKSSFFSFFLPLFQFFVSNHIKNDKRGKKHSTLMKVNEPNKVGNSLGIAHLGSFEKSRRLSFSELFENDVAHDPDPNDSDGRK